MNYQSMSESYTYQEEITEAVLNQRVLVSKLTMGNINRLPMLKKCCFCIPLRIGVAIVGYWSIATILAAMWFTITVMANMTVENSGGYNYMARAYMFRTLNVIVQVVYIVLSVMLLIGAHKKKPEYLRHFFVSGLVMTVVHSVALGFSFIYQFNWSLVIVVIFLASSIYSLLIVRSSYLAMEEKERGPTRCEPDEEVCWDTMQLAHVV